MAKIVRDQAKLAKAMMNFGEGARTERERVLAILAYVENVADGTIVVLEGDDGKIYLTLGSPEVRKAMMESQ